MASAINSKYCKLALLGLLLVAVTHAHAAQTSSGDDTTPDFQSYETKGILDDLNNAANQAWNAGVNMINGGANAAAQAANQAARDASNAYDYYTSSGKRSVAGGSVLAAVSMAVVMLAL